MKCPMAGCSFETSAQTKDALMQQTVAHAKAAHNLTTIPADVMAKVTAAVKETP